MCVPQVRMSYTSERTADALCHCQDCRKICGSYSNNVIAPRITSSLRLVFPIYHPRRSALSIGTSKPHIFKE